ncbi:MAG: glycosyltransferase family 4 protein [Acidobacteriota bacterium]|nr:glycosyltransferase family 4 protein [Acidobacteriota bacterium]
MRLLLVSDSYPPKLGGSEVEAQRVSAALLRAGHRVTVVCSGGPPMPPVRDWTDPEGVPVEILTRTSTGKLKDYAFAIRVAVYLLEHRRDYDAVYFLMQGLHLATGLPAARLCGFPIVMKISGDGIVSLMQRSRAGRFELACLRKWRIPVMLLNESMFAEAAAAGFPRGQLKWMPNPVDVDAFRPALPGERDAFRASHGLPASTRVAIYTGRLSPEKGLRFLISGFAAAVDEYEDALLIVVGDGSSRAELETLAQEKGLSPGRVRFVGRIDASAVPDWLRASDVFALTSPNEGFSCSLLEAMASGLPSLVSDIPANRQLIDPGIHGLTVPYDDVPAIGRAFVALFRNSEQRTAMAAEARKRVVENYSTRHIVERYEALFSEVIGRRGA